MFENRRPFSTIIFCFYFERIIDVEYLQGCSVVLDYSYSWLWESPLFQAFLVKMVEHI